MENPEQENFGEASLGEVQPSRLPIDPAMIDPDSDGDPAPLAEAVGGLADDETDGEG
jgi:hypothetical protein